MADRFNWQATLDEVYACYPEATFRPVIGITGNYGEATCKLGEGYYQSIVAAGGVPVVIPPVNDPATILNVLENIDALVLSGGADYNPLYAGEEPSSQLGGINATRDLPELLITRLAYNRQLPVLGICRGIQTLVMALDGKVAQDIRESVNAQSLKHSQDADRSEPTHSVQVADDSVLSQIYQGQTTLYVNSFHHQAVKDAGKRFRVVATATDGVIEAIESTEFKPIIGVQWHPECLCEGKPLFEWLIREATTFHKIQKIHDNTLTLDTHCDTPMFFPKGIQFGHRDPKILVDLHKMTEGRQDATIMVAYLPQTYEGNPTAYADGIFDEIERIADQYHDHLAIARTPEELYTHKREGRKSIMLGIENGLALHGDLANVKHFAERGIVYMTLCHNGDNDICDSARGEHTHHGLSDFGRQVIREMNRYGIMVDLSHANEDSFYQALELSETPIVCSHSSCRALCDHPRNLTDEQMKALAKAGGVAQITLYNGFLRKEGEASILDAMAHLEHAIQIMGVDHVGLGTDFDGDGGVLGLADSSELTNFTRQLLARHFSEEDIQKIWGGNFLRVMEIAQNKKRL